MTDRTGAVYDLGYAPYAGERLGRRGAIQSVVKDGVYRVLGLHRKARKKVMPWFLLALAFIPAAVFVGLAFLLPDFTPDAESPFGGFQEYFVLVGVIVLLFVALAGPELLIPDRRQGVLNIYSSRPLLPLDYVGARAGALVLVMGAFLLVPLLGMYTGFAALDSDGFVAALISDAGDLVRIVAATALYVIAYAPLAMFLAAFINRKGAATGIYLAIVIGISGVAEALLEASNLPGARYAALAPPADNADYVMRWIFGDTSTDSIAFRAGFDPELSLLIIAITALVLSAAVVVRYRRLM
jgi:ABC-2 type transport system permease protein